MTDKQMQDEVARFARAVRRGSIGSYVVIAQYADGTSVSFGRGEGGDPHKLYDLKQLVISMLPQVGLGVLNRVKSAFPLLKN